MKKITALFVSMALVVSLAGCKGNTVTDTTGAGETTQKTETKASEEKTEETQLEETIEKTIAGFDVSNMPEGGYTVALCNFSLGNTWRVQMVETFRQVAEEYKELGLIKEYYITNSDGDTAQQISDMEDLITMGVDIICLTAASPTALVPVVDEAMEEGITLISFDAGVDTDNVTASLVLDNTEFGRVDARWLADKIGGKGKVVVLAGQAGSKNAEQRVNGVNEVFAEYPDIEVAALSYCDYDYATAKAAIESIISVYNDIDGILSLGGAMSRACVDAYEAAGLELVPITGEANNGFLKMWNERQSDGFTSVCPISPNTSGAQALDLGLKAITGGEYKKENVFDIETVTDETLKDVVRTDLSDNYWAPSILSEEKLQELYGEN